MTYEYRAISSTKAPVYGKTLLLLRVLTVEEENLQHDSVTGQRAYWDKSARDVTGKL